MVYGRKYFGLPDLKLDKAKLEQSKFLPFRLGWASNERPAVIGRRLAARRLRNDRQKHETETNFSQGRNLKKMRRSVPCPPAARARSPHSCSCFANSIESLQSLPYIWCRARGGPASNNICWRDMMCNSHGIWVILALCQFIYKMALFKVYLDKL